MAYQTKDENDNAQQAGLLSGYGKPDRGAAGGLTPMTATPLVAPVQAKMYGAGGGPSVTGHVNFDRLYAANASTADRDARAMGSAADGAVGKAKTGLGGLQQQFTSQSVAATGRAPSANDVARSKGGGTPFYTPPPMAGAAGQQAFTVSGRQQPQGAQLAKDTAENWQANMQAQAAKTYSGPSSLQDVEGYSGLLKDYGAAGEALSGLKDDAHIQGALDAKAVGPHLEGGSKLDAALIGQSGRQDFANIRERNKSMPADFAAALKDSAERGGQASYEARVNAAKHQGLLDDYGKLGGTGAVGGGAAAGDSRKGWTPEGYGDLQSFLGGQQGSAGGFYQDAHNASQQISPADWLTRGLGEAGLDVPMASEAFGSAVAGAAAPKDAWATADTRTAFQTVSQEYGAEAAQWLWDHMTPEMWDSWQKLSNPGSVAREMRKLMEQGGYAKQPDASHDRSQVQQQGATAGEKDQGTTADEEAARNRAYADGWGDSYDAQFRNGNRTPQRGPLDG